MVNPRYIIEMDGERVTMLITPHFFSIANKKGIDIVLQKGYTTVDVLTAYTKIMWLAHLNYAELKKFDGEEIKTYTYEDFEIWSIMNSEEFAKIMIHFAEIFRGLGDEKKKMKK